MSRLSFDFGGLPGNFWDVHTATDEIPFISRLPIRALFHPAGSLFFYLFFFFPDRIFNS